MILDLWIVGVMRVFVCLLLITEFTFLLTYDLDVVCGLLCCFGVSECLLVFIVLCFGIVKNKCLWVFVLLCIFVLERVFT